MKKILLFASALAGLFLAGSCQKETLEPAAQGGVTYEITLPTGPQTKGEEGYDYYDLYYEVYKTVDADELAALAQPLFEDMVIMTGKTHTLQLDLLNDQDYTILFWANKKDGTDFNLTDLRQVGVNIPIAANNDDRDAFCGMDQLVQHDGAQSKTVTLTRPFAQVNVATLVPTAAEIGYDVTPTHSYVRVSSIPMTFNVFTGLPADNTVAAVEFSTADAPAEIPVDDITVNGTAYNWVAMNYILVPESVVEVYYEITTANGVVKNTISNVPVKKNYRTNIIGNLLTSNATYTIEVKPGFEEGDVYHTTDAEAAQAALDAAVDGSVIQLHPGVHYGTLYIRPVEGQKNTVTDCDYLIYRNEMLRKVENLTILGAPGATVDAIKVVSGYVENSGSTGYVVDIKNLVIDSVEFTDDYDHPVHKYDSPLLFDLSYINVDGLTVKNCELNGDNDKVNFVYIYGNGNPSNSTFETAAKNITITGNSVDGIARLCELRPAENVTLTGNTIKNTSMHAMLLAGGNGTYSGNVTISNNTAEAINERFVRMAAAGDAVVVITDNTIRNYLGADADYIKVTDGTNVKIENNQLISNATTVDAFNAALENSDVINVTADLNFGTSGFIAIENDITLNFNHKELVAGGGSTKNASISVFGDYSAVINDANITGGSLMFYYGADVELNNVSLTYNFGQSGRNMIYAASDNDNQVVTVIDGGTYTMTGGSGNRYVCAHGNAIVYIKGGTFMGKGYGASNAPIEAVNIAPYTAQVIISGGTFDYDPSKDYITTRDQLIPPTATIAAGYKVVDNGNGTWSVVAE